MVVYVPYWFLLLVSTALWLLVWRKTRGRVDPGRAFPVEVAKEAGAASEPCARR